MTLLFIHGAGFTGAAFARQTDAFEGCHTPNLPGHEASGEAAEISDFAAFIETYVRDRALRDVVLCGHSMGGAVALNIALTKPAWLRSCILMDSGARLRVAPEFLAGFRNAFEATARTMAEAFFDEPQPALVDWALASLQRVGRDQVIRDFEACGRFDVLKRLGEISVPFLAIAGEHDRLTPPKYAHALADRIAGAQTRILRRAGHLAMVERPEETNAAIRAFVTA